MTPVKGWNEKNHNQFREKKQLYDPQHHDFFVNSYLYNLKIMEGINQPANTANESVRQGVIDGLTKDPRIDTSKIHVEVESGKVILKGKADTETEKQLSEEIARSVPGVTGVENHLHVDLGIIHALTSLAAHIQADIIKDDNDKET